MTAFARRSTGLRAAWRTVRRTKGKGKGKGKGNRASLMHQGFLRYRDFRYLKLALALSVASIIAYAVHHPHDPPNGGTWLGYTLGSVGALLILWLLWFGVRKRQYQSNAGQLNGWLSAHVYLGASLVLVATLHAGFQFGWNVHTFAWVLTMLVVLSGFYGIWAYTYFPTAITRNRAGFTRDAMLAEIAELDRESLVLADQVGREAHAVVLKSIEETCLGGSWREQLFGDPARRASSGKASSGLEELQRRIESRIRRATEASIEEAVDHEATAMGFLAGQLEGGAERLGKVRHLLDLIQRKRTLVAVVQRDIQSHARMMIWLYLHLPLSLALLAALAAHVVSVFLYW